jgi:alkylation response protein AidB-like acyl-CoA dehydrogenase
VTFLRAERATLEQFLPGLDKRLADVPLMELEKPGNPALDFFREAGGPALLVPAEYGGHGAGAVDAVRIQRALGSRSPSLAVATTMHHFSVASLVELTAAGNGFEWAMLQAIAENGWLMSSGFAEGRAGQHILIPTMTAERTAEGLRVNGRKRPCSLTWSMDLLSASVAVRDPGGSPDRMAIVLVPASTPGIERRPFWRSDILAGAESDEVSCTDVLVPEALAFFPAEGPSMDPIQARGFAWFELLIAASYVGAASGLAERALGNARGGEADRVALAIELESAAAALERVAGQLAEPAPEEAADTDAFLARALFVRYAAEQAIERSAMAAAALAGGTAFIGSAEVGYLLAACRALAFHPPSRAAASAPLAGYLAGQPLSL